MQKYNHLILHIGAVKCQRFNNSLTDNKSLVQKKKTNIGEASLQLSLSKRTLESGGLYCKKIKLQVPGSLVCFPSSLIQVFGEFELHYPVNSFSWSYVMLVPGSDGKCSVFSTWGFQPTWAPGPCFIVKINDEANYKPPSFGTTKLTLRRSRLSSQFHEPSSKL